MANGKEIKDYKEALEKALTEQYPNHNITVFKRFFAKDFNPPAIIISPPVLIPRKDFKGMKGQMMNTLYASVFLLYSAANEENESECLQLSANLANFINNNSWGLKLSPATVTINEPFHIEEFEDYIIQQIDFEQNITITKCK